jgi:hypothetical protein
MAISRFSSSRVTQGLPKYQSAWDQDGVQQGAIVPISHTVVSNVSTGVAFGPFPTWAQDLRFVIQSRNTGTNGSMNIYFNADVSSGNYSTIFTQGDGASATSTRNTSQNYFTPSMSTVSTDTANLFTTLTVDLLNWQSSTFKTILWRYASDKNGSGTTRLDTSLWRSTSAITNFIFAPSAGEFAPGSTFACYGIKAGS